MSDTKKTVGVNERVLAAIVDIQHDIKHSTAHDTCAACPRWDKLQSAAVALVAEVRRLMLALHATEIELERSRLNKRGTR